jgi:hypothetical protein
MTDRDETVFAVIESIIAGYKVKTSENLGRISKIEASLRKGLLSLVGIKLDDHA